MVALVDRLRPHVCRRLAYLEAVPSVDCEGGWLTDEPSVYELSFVPTTTDVKACHLWCEQGRQEGRRHFPGSPYPVACTSTAVVSEKIDTSGVLPGDYRVDLAVFEDAQKRWGVCTIDAFASKATKVLGRFWAPTDIPGLEGLLGVDALSQPWERGERIWAHPPIELLDRVVRKLRAPERTAEVIVCAPQHKTKAWYVALCGLAQAQLKHGRGHLDRFSKQDCPSRLSEWPITLFHIAARDEAPQPGTRPAVPKLAAPQMQPLSQK